MKKRNLVITALLAIVLAGAFAFYPKPALMADALTGAWQQQENGGEDVLLFMDGYCTQTMYKKEEKKFGLTCGGTYTVDGNNMQIKFEFDTENADHVGMNVFATFKIDGDKLQITIDGNSETWRRVDNGQAPLAGVWRITDRMQDGKLTPIHQTGPRKTLKILTGTRFQWAAINPETKEFSGSGGGTYTFANGKYTENIEFFSRDSSRVGASLSFEGKLENGGWHHSGKSSRGDSIYEVWGKVYK